MLTFLGPVTWAWIIIIGVLMITPGGVECIACGSVLTKILGVASIILGAAAFAVNRRATRS